MAVLIAGTAALLGVPRPVPPDEIPEPAVSSAALEAVIRADEERARSITPPPRGSRGRRFPRKLFGRTLFQSEDEAPPPPARTLDHDVRALGEAVRAFGRAESEGDVVALEKAHGEAVQAAGAAIGRSPDDVLVLRAYQTHGFVRAMKELERTGEASPDLIDLAGVFPRLVELYRWYDRPASEPGRRLLPDEPTLRAMYKKRWNELTALTGTAFALTLDEERALFRFRIAHPAVPYPALPAGAGPAAARARALADSVAANENRLGKIRELARLDPEYPAALAEGVVLFHLGRFEQAAMAFERHLAAHPDGPWTLRARNHLKAALEAR